MTIQASARSALILTAALAAAAVLGLAGTHASYAAANSAMQPSVEAAGAVVTPPLTTDANAAAGIQESAPAMPSPLAGSTVAENTEPGAATASIGTTADTMTASNDDNSGWDKASIIGKIFIACGTLLTLGSAARMFMV